MGLWQGRGFRMRTLSVCCVRLKLKQPLGWVLLILSLSWRKWCDLLWLAWEVWRDGTIQSQTDERAREVSKPAISSRAANNQRLRKAVSDLTLDKLILNESLDYFKPKAWQHQSYVRPLSTVAKNSTHLNVGRALCPVGHGAASVISLLQSMMKKNYGWH